MTDEIIATWDRVGNLVRELSTSSDSDRKTKQKINGIREPLVMHFRLEDGNGDLVVWPLKLISDTTTSHT